jgi:pimeloyl-ACP methyl ester carboxylesterase
VFIEAAGVQVHYVERGAEPGPGVPTAVLLHGFTVDHRVMLEPFESVFAARASWRRVYLDLPGMGATRAPDWVRSTDDVFRVVRAAVDALVPGRFVAIGESYGGYLARGLAAAEPERVEGLGLLCPMIVPEHARRDVPKHRVLVRDPELLARVGAADLDADDVGVVQTPETWRRTLAEVAPGLAAADPAVVERIQGAYAGTFPLEPRPFDRPTLFVLGRQDSSTGYRDAWRVLESYPSATFAVLDRAGHNLQIEQPRLFEALVDEWLDRVEEARSGH